MIYFVLILFSGFDKLDFHSHDVPGTQPNPHASRSFLPWQGNSTP